MTRLIRNLVVAIASIGVCSMAVAAEGDHFVKTPGTVLTKAEIQSDWENDLSHWGQFDPYNVLLPVATHYFVYTNIPDTLVGHVPEEELRQAKAKSGYSAASLAAIQQYFAYPTSYGAATKECQLVQSEEEVDYSTLEFGPRVVTTSTPMTLTIQKGTYNWNALNKDMAALVTANSAVLLETAFGKDFSSAAPEAFATALKDLDYAHGYYVACPVDAKNAFLEKTVYAPVWSGQPVAVALKNELEETCSVLVTAVAYNATTKKYACYLQWGDENHYDDLNGWYDLTAPFTIEMTDYIAFANIPFYPKEISHTWTLVGATTLIAPQASQTIIPVVGRIVDVNKDFKSLEGFTVTTGSVSTKTTKEGSFALTAPANQTLILTVKDKKSVMVGSIEVTTGAFPQSRITDFKTLNTLVPAIQEIPVETPPVVEATYTITFNANGGVGGKTVTQAAGTTLTAPTVTREGYEFKGWSPAVPEKVPAQNTTYTAQWQVKQYTMTFNANGGVGAKSVTQDYGTKLAAPTVTREGYTFKEWYPVVPATVPAKNVTYTAQWEKKVVEEPDGEDKPIIVQYTVTFDANNGTEVTKVTQAAGEKLAAPLVTREGYEFMGWAPEVPTVSPAADVTYTAQWQIKKVDVNLLVTTPMNKKGETTITGVKSAIANWLDIPETLNGAKVVAIADGAFKGQTKLTKVTLPNTITLIGKDAFAGCSNLDVNAIIMPNQPKLKVGKGAFTGCKVEEVKAVPGEPLTSKQLGKAAGYKVATSVSGLKLNAKTGDITATFKKSGTYEAVLFKPSATLKAIRIKVGDMPKLTIKMEGEDTGCSVKGAGSYLMGKKVSISAKASKAKIFVGFYYENGKELTTNMKYSYVMEREDVTIIAKFKEEVITIDTSALTSKTWKVGETVNVTIPVTAESGVKSVKAKLPTGLKLAKTKDGKWQVTGSPKKYGIYSGTITVGTVQKKQASEKFTIEVLAEITSLDLAMVKDVKLNVNQGVSNIVIDAEATSEIKSIKASKLPAGMKVQLVSGKWQLTGTPKKAGTYKVTFTMTTKAGTKVVETIELIVNLVPEWAAKAFSGEVINVWEDDDGNWEEVSGTAEVTILPTGEVKGGVYLEDNARALLSGTAKLLESSANKVCLQIVVPWLDSDGKADGRVKTELIIQNKNGTVTLDYRDSAKDSYVTGKLDAVVE